MAESLGNTITRMPLDLSRRAGFSALRLAWSGAKALPPLPPVVGDRLYAWYWGGLPEGQTPSQRFVGRLKDGYIESELNVVRNGVEAVQADARRAERLAAMLAANPKKNKELSPKQEALLKRAPLTEAHIRGYMWYGGKVVARGLVTPNTEEFPYRTTSDHVDQFIEVADLAYSGVKAQASIDPPLRPVGYPRDVFQTLYDATEPQLNPTARIIPLR